MADASVAMGVAGIRPDLRRPLPGLGGASPPYEFSIGETSSALQAALHRLTSCRSVSELLTRACHAHRVRRHTIMPLSLAVSPAGHLLAVPDDETEPRLSDAASDRLHAAFHASSAHGLEWLASDGFPEAVPPAIV
ncbi:MAG: hypothetical protein KF791_20535, partial [Verrucomicrobiae bacterium]|nr:hypothetical protein [Verrucomicrobiae bacterium]